MSELAITPLPYHADPCHYFERVRTLTDAVLLDSNQHSDDRYTLISAEPDCRLRLHNNQLTLERAGQAEPLPLDQLATCHQTLLEELGSPDAKGLPFAGGLIGYWGYELARHLQPGHLKRQSELPDLIIGRYLWALILDHQTQSAHFIAHSLLPSTRQQALCAQLLRTERPPSTADFSLQRPFQADISQQDYNRAFATIQRYILAGDCYQVNLTQRFSAPYAGDLWHGYRKLRQVSPVPYSAFLAFPELSIASFSPEQFLLCDQGQVTTKPIKGTAPRGATLDEDQELALALTQSTKDRAENLMIVDLLRNDLGRCCQTGSVKVPKLFALESFANVHHLVSTITGTLAGDQQPVDLLLSAFPGGSITGAPKIRAMEIIEELEAHPRSVYCGSIGYISCHGRMETNIAIRTLVANQQTLYCWGGGGIVADSTAAAEYAEAVHKVQNLLSGLA